MLDCQALDFQSRYILCQSCVILFRNTWNPSRNGFMNVNINQKLYAEQKSRIHGPWIVLRLILQRAINSLLYPSDQSQLYTPQRFVTRFVKDGWTHELDDFDGIFVTVMLIPCRFCFRFQSSSTNKMTIDMTECFAAITGFTPDWNDLSEITTLKTRMKIQSDSNESTLVSMIRNIHYSEMSFIHNFRSVFSGELSTLNNKTVESPRVCHAIEYWRTMNCQYDVMLYWNDPFAVQNAKSTIHHILSDSWTIKLTNKDWFFVFQIELM